MLHFIKTPLCTLDSRVSRALQYFSVAVFIVARFCRILHEAILEIKNETKGMKMKARYREIFSVQA